MLQNSSRVYQIKKKQTKKIVKNLQVLPLLNSKQNSILKSRNNAIMKKQGAKMNQPFVLALVTLISLYPDIKEILGDIKQLTSKNDSHQIRQTSWKQNKKTIFQHLFLFIFFLLLFSASLLAAIGGILSHNIFISILFSATTIISLPYVIIPLLLIVIKTILILSATSNQIVKQKKTVNSKVTSLK